MLWRTAFIAGWLAVLITAAPAPCVQETPSERAERILREVDDMWRGKSSDVTFSMQVKTVHYTRNMRMRGWSKGKDESLVVLLSPLRERGTATLKSGQNIFTYLPKTDRTIRLTAGMMMGSWMGSHFTNDDLVKESRLAEDYAAAISFEGERGGQEVLEFTLMPEPDAAVVWGKIVITVRKPDHLPLDSIYYDEDMAVVRTMTFTDPKEMDGRLVQTRLRVEPVDKPDEFTELVYEDMKFDVAIEDSFFSLAQLKHTIESLR